MQFKKLKIITIVGTRPELIRLSRIMGLLDEYTNHILVHTGQNYDYELNEVFFTDLDIRKPDYFYNINNSSIGKAYGDILIKTEELLLKEKPDAVLILGDTNSSISAIIAKRMHIPIYHMEAGNRCFDANVPEEINRKIVDHISDFNLVYTEHARRNLIAEGFPARRIYLTGSPMLEVLNYYSDKITKSVILKKLKLEQNKYFLVSTHREENVDNPIYLKQIIEILKLLADYYSYPVIVSTHPRTQKKLRQYKLDKKNDKITFLKPFGLTDYIKLQKNSFCVVSDSGTISEESSLLGFPAITIRNSMERPEALDTGSISLTGFDMTSILGSINFAVKTNSMKNINSTPSAYLIENTSHRVVRLILGTSHLSNKWDNIAIKKD